MTTVYIPRPIRTVEDAEGLPEGTIVLQEDKDGPWEKWHDGSYRGASKTVVGPDRVIGRFALVPVEAEEETRAFYDSSFGTTICVPVDERVREKGRVEARLVTSWEAVEEA